MKKRFKTVAVLLAMSMAVMPMIGAAAEEEPASGYNYYHQEFTNIGAEQRLAEGAQTGNLKGWTAHYDDSNINSDSSKPEGVYITESGTLKLQTYKLYNSNQEIIGQPAASFDYSDFSGKEGNYTILFKMKVTGGNRVNAVIGKQPSGLQHANTAYALTAQLATGFGYEAGSVTALKGTNATEQTKSSAGTWYDVQMYINNTDRNFNIWIDGVPQKDDTNGCDLPLSSRYTGDYIAPSVLTFTIQPASSNKNLAAMEIDDVRIMSGKYDLLYQNSNWNSMPSYGRATGEKLIIDNGARYNDDSLSLVGQDSTSSDYNAQFRYINDLGTNVIDATKPVVTEMSFMPIENVGQVYFAQQAGSAISYRINPSNLRVGQWNKIKFVYIPATETEPLTSEIYLNGQRCYKNAFTDGSNVAAPTQTRLCVSRNPDDNIGDKTTDNLQNVKCAIDDVKIYQTDADADLSEKYPSFTPPETWVATPAATAARYGGDLYIPEVLNVSAIAAQVGSDTEVRLFEGDLSTPADEAVDGTKLVLVSSTDVYAYYNVQILNIAFTGTAVEGQSDGTVIDGELTATVGGTARTYGALVLAQYDKDDRMIRADAAAANESGTAFSVTQTVTAETKTVRAFFWQDLDNSVAPVMEQKILTKASVN